MDGDLADERATKLVNRRYNLKAGWQPPTSNIDDNTDAFDPESIAIDEAPGKDRLAQLENCLGSGDNFQLKPCP